MSQPSLLLETAFVDRDKETNRLKTLHEQTLAGNGCTVFIVGEGGVGKTRLVREFKRHVESKGSIFLEGASYEQEGTVPYSPWIDIIRSMLKRTPTNSFRSLPTWVIAEVGRLVPTALSEAESLGLKAWLQGPKQPLAALPSTDQDRIRLFQAIMDFLSISAGNRGLVLFLDDVGWADNASLQLFNYVARRTKDQKMMLVGAYRDIELADEHPLTRVALDLNRQRIAQQVSIARFTDEFVSKLLATQLHGLVSQDLSHLIYSRTGGNAFFVEEIVRSLIDDGLLRKTDQGWTVSDIERLEIPTSIRALIKQRLGRLGEECNQLLSIAALVGMEFDYELLRRVAVLPEEALMNFLEDALKAKLIREEKKGGRLLYVFADEQSRRFLTEQVSLLRKRKYHVALGHALEETYAGTIDDHVEELAYHFVQGGEAAKAKEYSIRAGDRSARLYAHADALRHYSNALELLREDEAQLKLDLLTKLAQVSYVRSNHKEVLRFAKDAIDVAQKLGLKIKLAELYGLLGISHFILAESRKDALESFLEGLKTLEGTKDTFQEAVLLQHIARVYMLTGERAIGESWVRRAIEVASKLGAKEVLAHSYITLALALSLKEKEAILGYLEKALDLAIENKLGEQSCRAYNNLATVYSQIKGDYRRSEEIYLKGIEYARTIGSLDQETFMRAGLIADAYFPIGEWEACERVSPEALRIGRELGDHFILPTLAVLASIAVARGQWEKAKGLLDEILPLARKVEWEEFVAMCHEVASAFDLEQGHLGKAEEELVATREHAKRIRGHGIRFSLGADFGLIRTNLKKRKIDDAIVYYQEIKQITADLDEKWGYAFEKWAGGLIAEAQGNSDQAIIQLKECVELWKAVGRPYDLARGLIDLKRMYEERGNKREAQEALNEANKIFERLRVPVRDS